MGRMGLFKIRCDSVGRIDLTGQPSQRTRGYSQQRMGFPKKSVSPGKIVEHANIVGYYYRQLLSLRKSSFEVFTMTLDSGGDGCQIDSIRAIAYTTPPAPRAERKYLPETVKQKADAALVALLQVFLQY